MKIAIEAAPRMRPATWPLPTATALHKAAGLLLVVGVPTLFWTLVVLLVTNGAGVEIGAPALATFAATIAVLSMTSAALFMRSQN